MPKILDRLTRQLMAQGKTKAEATGIATRSLQRAGVLKRGTTELTAKGKVRNAMTAGQRAKSRAAKASGRPASQFKFNARTNRATLKASARRK